jgi:hypothetical protein
VTRGDVFESLRAAVEANGHTFQTVRADAATLAGVSAELALPPRLSALYAESGPAERSSIPWVVEDMSFFSVRELVSAQEGYRWIGAEREPSPLWSADWVVVASVYGDPFFVHTTRESCPVLFARHGAGTWSPTEIASSMESFVAALVEFEQVLLGDFRLEVWNDDGLIPAFVQDVEQRVGTVLTTDQTARFIGILD